MKSAPLSRLFAFLLVLLVLAVAVPRLLAAPLLSPPGVAAGGLLSTSRSAPVATAWTDFTPSIGQWIGSIPTSVSVTASNIDGLTDAGGFRASIDGGNTWSEWRTDNLQVQILDAATRRLTASPLVLSEGINFIQFRIHTATNTDEASPAYPLYVDTQAPPSPINPQPQPGAWSGTNAFGATWTNPSDPNGIGGAWYKLDTAPTGFNDGIFVDGTNINSISNVTVDGDGEHVLWLWLADGLGHANSSTAVTVTLKLDMTPPGALSNASADPSTWTHVNQFNLVWTAPSDPTGIAGVRYRFDAPPATPDDGTLVPGAANGISGFTIPGAAEGAHQLWVWPVDGAGNGALPASAVSVMLRLDQTPPSPPVTVPQVTPTGWQTDTTTSYTLTWQNPADASGIAGACYKLGTAPTSNVDGVCVDGPNLNQITSITAPAPGSYHLFLWLRDGAGNSDQNRRSTALDAVRWDPAAPDLFVDASGTMGLNGWYRGPVDLTLIATDLGSGLASVQYNLDGVGFTEGRQLHITADGQHNLLARATDVAANQTQIGPNAYLIDSQPPHTTLSLGQTPVFQDWFTTTVTATLVTTDAISGPDYVQWRLDGNAWQQGTTATVTTEGEHTLEYRGVDHAGNIEQIRTQQIGIDLSPPVTSYFILPSATASGWYTQPVSITLVPADDGAGVADTLYRLDGGPWQNGAGFQLSDSGEHTVDFYSVDRLGQQETPYRIPGGIRIDRDAPRAPTPIGVSPNSWTNQNQFNLLMAVPPDLSGIDGAYVKIGAPPTTNTDGAWNPGSSSVLQNIQLPGEGRYKAYVWLRDVAGNVDSAHRGIWEQAFALSYDATAPQTDATLTGKHGERDWFTSPVTVTLVATDTHSGVAITQVSIDGEAPVTTTVFNLTTPDKHTLRFKSTDVATNVEPERLVTVRIDPDAPNSPQGVTTNPQGWSRLNSFSLMWTNPSDLSGIAAGYYKVGTPPLNPKDGTSIPPTGNAIGITVPGDGAWDIHFWLVDQAGNVDLSTKVTRASALRYDGVPPATSSTILQGVQGQNGWYTSRVIVRLAATDSVSGVASMHYRIDGGPWVEAIANASLSLTTTGQHMVEYQATDAAGNVEPIRQLPLKLDLAAPLPLFEATNRYQRQTSFPLSWNASDEATGSGRDGFELQFRDGRNGAWQAWGATNVPDTSGRFYGNLGHHYFFRMRARDNAGNLSSWVELPWGVYIDRVVNGDFAGGSFGAWQHSGPLAQSVLTTAAGPMGQTSFVAQLGSPDYGPNVPGLDIPSNSLGDVPVGSGQISQQIRIPGLDVLDRPTLSLWYRIYTYDTAYGANQQKEFDTLDARLIGSNGEWLALRDGLPFKDWQAGKFADMGWRYASVEVPASWAGETATLSIDNWNRIDGRLNTWSWVTDIRMWEPYRVYLPQLSGSGSPVGAQAAEAAPTPSPSPDSLR